MPDEIEDLPEGQDSFDRAYVEKLRAEAAKYRTTLRPFEEAFGDFNDQEKAFLFDMLQTLNTDPAGGAVKFRDMAKNILKEQFYEGLDDMPSQKEDSSTDSETDEETEDPVSLTKEEMQAMLDDRDKRAQEEAEKGRQAAEVEKVFAEIEAAGFERGSEGFMTALSLGQTQANLGKEVDFSALAPKVRSLLDLPEPEGEGEGEAEATEGEPEAEEDNSGFPKTAGAGGSGGAGEPPKDWIAEAKESGKNVMDVARERMEARLSLDG